MASQIPNTSVVAENSSLHTKPGVVVAHGHDFVVERVALAHPTTYSLHGRTSVAHSFYRVTITAGPYQVRDMPAIVSVNGHPLSMGMESPDLSSLMAFTFDHIVVTNGATMAVSYGLPNATSTIWTSKIEVVK